MLLEFTLDTDETKLTESALELRRRVAGRRVEKVKDVDTLLELKQRSKKELEQQRKEDIRVGYAAIQERVSQIRSDHHLVVTAQVR